MFAILFHQPWAVQFKKDCRKIVEFIVICSTWYHELFYQILPKCYWGTPSAGAFPEAGVSSAGRRSERTGVGTGAGGPSIFL